MYIIVDLFLLLNRQRGLRANWADTRIYSEWRMWQQQ